jgi:hypothetical protein
MNPEAETVKPVVEDPRPLRAYPETRERYVDDPRRKSTLVAGVLAVFPGLGHAYVGYYRQAFLNIGIVCAVIFLLASGDVDGLEPPLGTFLGFFWLFNVIDAVRRASLYNQVLSGLRAMDLPDDVMDALPVRFGSLGGGAIAIVVGLVLLTRTMLGWSLAWVESWWPMGLVAVGVWLVVADLRARQEKKAKAASVPSEG